MKYIRRITLIISLLLIALLIISSLYIKNGYQIYFDLGFIKLGNSNNNIIYIIIGLLLAVLGIYFLFKQIINHRGIIISICLFFTIFLLPFIFLITDGMNRNHSFTYKTESNKDLLIMGYGKNTNDINMKYEIYERLVLGFYEKIGEINDISYILSSEKISSDDLINNEEISYYEDNNSIIFSYLDDTNNKVNITMEYKH